MEPRRQRQRVTLLVWRAEVESQAHRTKEEVGAQQIEVEPVRAKTIEGKEYSGGMKCSQGPGSQCGRQNDD